MIVLPSLWGVQIRVRLSNTFRTRPVTFSGVHVGRQCTSATIVAGTNRKVTFGRARTVTLARGEQRCSASSATC